MEKQILTTEYGNKSFIEKRLENMFEKAKENYSISFCL